jgi:hypothetical protein
MKHHRFLKKRMKWKALRITSNAKVRSPSTGIIADSGANEPRALRDPHRQRLCGRLSSK